MTVLVALLDAPDLEITLQDEAAMGRLATALASVAQQRDVITLNGPLGVGKTAFARAFIAALAARQGAAAPAEVPSPTFTLVQTYKLDGLAVWHFDLYRLSRPEDVLELGIDEAFAEAVTLIEWPDRLGAALPADRLDVALSFERPDRPEARRALLTGHGSWAERIAHVA
jgi:tRNA threonylcarbamoyladenosine biosynthesis protein TsaE